MSRPTIETRYEHKRGCGYRQAGGIYLVAGALAKPCGKLPIPLTVCEYCGSGYKPARGWTWIKPEALIKGRKCDSPKECFECPLGPNPPERAGLLWIGEKHYRTPDHFAREAVQMGISRRLNGIPRDLVVGETWVFCAHRKSNFVAANMPEAEGDQPEAVPAIFTAFRPSAIEYVVKGTETDGELRALVKRGFTLVDVKKLGDESGDLFPTSEETEDDLDDDLFGDNGYEGTE
jgi:hypothetical protein